MTPSELRQLLLFGDPTTHNYSKLPAGAGALWITRPHRNHIDRARRFMYLRAAFIAASLIYYYFFHRGNDDIRALLIILACYEFAYYTAISEKDELEYMLARERYAESVEAFLSEST